MKKLHSDSIRSYLENITGNIFPDIQYEFKCISKSPRSRISRVVGIVAIDKKGNEIVHNCNVENMDFNNLDKLTRDLKRIRGTSFLRKIRKLN